MKRVLISGFGPFPGAPSNPTMAIVRHLKQCRLTRFRDVELVVQELPTEWGILKGFKKVVLHEKPDAVLMFGLSGRRFKVSPEKRAINRALLIRSDANGRKPTQLHLQKGEAAFRRSSFDAIRMAASMRQAGIKAAASSNAGEYLCNALLWTALETEIPAIFVHVPLPRSSRRKISETKSKRPKAAVLAKAGEIALASVLGALRQR